MKTKLQKFNQYLTYIMALLYPIALFYLFESYTHNAFTTMKFPIQLLNYLFFELAALLLFFLIGRLHIAFIVESGLFAFIGLANYFVIQFRSAPIMPWDIFSIRTAASVANNFKYNLSRNTVFTLLGFLLLIFIATGFRTLKVANWKKRLLGILICCMGISGLTVYVQQPSTVSKFRMYDKLFTPTVMSKRDGTAIAFMMELQYLTVKKPSGYDEQTVIATLDAQSQSAEASNTAGNAAHRPNIIVIMNEAFSDLSILGDFKTNEDYMPFMHSLMDNGENTVSGHLNVSVLGGNTANTEFEFLTGNSMAFLPQGSIPYQQYITQSIDSTPNYLKTLGYSTIGMHPYRAKGWDRERVYPLLGLDTSYFEDSFTDPLLIRKYISDESNYKKIQELYEEKGANNPLFLFNVTMQNHSSYTDSFPNFTPEIAMDGDSSDALNNYLSLIKISDSALEDLIQYFKEQSEDTIIVFFGDHQPANSVVEPIWKLQGKSNDTLTDEELNLRYKVPFIVWANYDIPEESGVETSANFLASRVLSIAGIPLSDYDSYLTNLQQSYPVISAIQATDANGTSTPVADQSEQLNEYQQIQYYQIFKNR
ncbi:MAG: LTA synthase family protein [Lachnospiraceae bacterium]|nr:LTA synthase family protein [Lachnospiraceae bacterium]